MIDMLAYRQRLATLAEGLRLDDDEGPSSPYSLFVAHLRDAFATTPVADLREVARRLGHVPHGRARDVVICTIAYAWSELPAAERVAPSHTDAEVRDTLARIEDVAGALAASTGDLTPERLAPVLRAIRSLVASLPE